jgi:hypothetical protein
MKISIYAPYAKEPFETARQHSFCILSESWATRQASGSARCSGGRLDADLVVYGRPNTRLQPR